MACECLDDPEAITEGQFSGASNAATGYDEIAFLSQQATSSAQDQIDLQEDIWNVFGGDRYLVTMGMQTYLNLLSTPAYASFNFSSVRFLEDADQSAGRAQAFVVSSTTPGLSTVTTPEPVYDDALRRRDFAVSVTAFQRRKAGTR